MRRVLVVDDEPSIRAMLVRILERKELAAADKIDTADCGAAALELLSKHDDYDLVISDTIMPNTDLDALFAKILGHPAGPAVVAIGGAIDSAPAVDNPRIVRVSLPVPVTAIVSAVADASARRPSS